MAASHLDRVGLLVGVTEEPDGDGGGGSGCLVVVPLRVHYTPPQFGLRHGTSAVPGLVLGLADHTHHQHRQHGQLATGQVRTGQVRSEDPTQNAYCQSLIKVTYSNVYFSLFILIVLFIHLITNGQNTH